MTESLFIHKVTEVSTTPRQI